MDEEERVNRDYQTRIQFLIVEMSRESLYFCFILNSTRHIIMNMLNLKCVFNLLQPLLILIPVASMPWKSYIEVFKREKFR